MSGDQLKDKNPCLLIKFSALKKYSLDKEQTTYDDLLDSLRLSLKGYSIKKIKFVRGYIDRKYFNRSLTIHN
jgi:hypothetical protein